MPRNYRQRFRLFVFVAFLFSLSGGPFGMETMLPTSGPGMTLLLLVVIGPLLYGVPMILTVSELGAAIPVQGGYYRWVRRSLGDFLGFQVGWGQWLTGLLDMALYPVVIVSFLDWFVWQGVREHVVSFGPVSFPWLSWLLCMAVIVPCMIINLRGVNWVGFTAIGLDLLIVGPYIIFAVLAFFQWKYNPFTPFVPPGESVMSALGYGLLVAMWNYSGYESPSVASEEIDQPSRTIPRGLFTSLPLEIAGYTIPVVAALMVRNDWSTWSEGSFVDIARDIGSIFPGGSTLLALLITAATIAGCLSIFNAGLLLGARLPFAMAEDRFLPKALSRLHPRYDTPWIAILFNCSIYSVLIFLPFQELLIVSIWLYIPIQLLIYVTLWVMRLREPHLKRPFKIPWGWRGLLLVTIPPSAVAVCALLVSVWEVVEAANLRLLFMGVTLLVSGTLAYGVRALWEHHARGVTTS